MNLNDTTSPSSPPNNPPNRLFACFPDDFVKLTLMSLAGVLNVMTISVGGLSNVSPSWGKDETSGEWAFAVTGRTNKMTNRRFFNIVITFLLRICTSIYLVMLLLDTGRPSTLYVR